MSSGIANVPQAKSEVISSPLHENIEPEEDNK
jgi:hypothetical protein